jgi:hypothetical protein
MPRATTTRSPSKTSARTTRRTTGRAATKTARRATTKTAPRAKRPAKKPVRILSPAQVAAAVATMAAPSGTARFAAGKALVATARQDPARVYPHLATFVPLLAGASKVVRWNALQVLAALAPADTGRQLDAHLDTYLAFITGGNLISAANAIQGAGLIAQARPDLVDRIIPAILAVESATYETAECRNVAIGHALDTFTALDAAAVAREPGEFSARVLTRADVVAFILRQHTNARPAVARHAQQLTPPQ